MAAKLKDISGQRFGRLVAQHRAESTDSRVARWVCICDCGGQHVAFGHHLRSARTTECPECWRAKRQNHNESNTRLYVIWQGMRKRCGNPKFRQFADYGGKGVCVCSEWQDFQAFKAWALSNGYTGDLTIDRIDPAGNYEPGNCEWVTRAENTRRANFCRWSKQEAAHA